MIIIKRKSIIIEMDQKDLWHLGTTLINGILLEVQKKWVVYHKGENENDFLEYVKLQNHIIFLYLKEIFIHLGRMDILESLEKDIIIIYTRVKDEKNIQKRDF